ESHDARFKADRRVDAAGCGAACGVAEIGIKIFNLCRPRAENCIFKAEASGPSRAVCRCVEPIRQRLNVTARANLGDIEQRAVERISDAPTRGREPAGLDPATRRGANACTATVRVSHPITGAIAFKSENKISVLRVEAQSCAEHPSPWAGRSARQT